MRRLPSPLPQADPAKLAELNRLQGEQVLQPLTLDNQDRADARSQTVDLAKTGSRSAEGAAICLVVLETNAHWTSDSS